MELFLDILGYGIIFGVVVLLFYLFIRILAGALSAMTSNDD